MADPDDPVGVTLRVVEVLDALGVRYLLGGGLASIVHGVIRTTQDADLVAELRAEHAEPLARAFGEDFYADVGTIRDAIAHRGSFNVLHLDTMFKVDVYVSLGRGFEASRFQRRVLIALATGPERRAWVSSAEDTILAKLEWYRAGGEVSERQWGDVLGVVRTQRDRLDRPYMERWAAHLGVADLLARAWSASAE